MAFFATGKMIAAAGAAVLSLLTGFAQAACMRQHRCRFEQWKADFAAKAKAAGVKNKGLSASAGANYPRERSKLTAPSTKLSAALWKLSYSVAVASTIISKGRSLKKSNAALFNKIESTYGVPPGVLLAIWGMETGFGASMGKQNTVSAILTLAYDCRRPDFFTRMPSRRSSWSIAARSAPASVGAMHGEMATPSSCPAMS